MGTLYEVLTKKCGIVVPEKFKDFIINIDLTKETIPIIILWDYQIEDRSPIIEIEFKEIPKSKINNHNEIDALLDDIAEEILHMAYHLEESYSGAFFDIVTIVVIVNENEITLYAFNFDNSEEILRFDLKKCPI